MCNTNAVHRSGKSEPPWKSSYSPKNSDTTSGPLTISKAAPASAAAARASTVLPPPADGAINQEERSIRWSEAQSTSLAVSLQIDPRSSIRFSPAASSMSKHFMVKLMCGQRADGIPAYYEKAVKRQEGQTTTHVLLHKPSGINAGTPLESMVMHDTFTSTVQLPEQS
eukprot:641636-Pelagomonas_calceolata.AAC.10